jgi:hypothetical protein
MEKNLADAVGVVGRLVQNLMKKNDQRRLQKETK